MSEPIFSINPSLNDDFRRLMRAKVTTGSHTFKTRANVAHKLYPEFTDTSWYNYMVRIVSEGPYATTSGSTIRNADKSREKLGRLAQLCTVLRLEPHHAIVKSIRGIETRDLFVYPIE